MEAPVQLPDPAAAEHGRLTPGRPAPPHAGWRLGGWWVAGAITAVVHNGFWATPNLAFMTLVAEHPGENPFSGAINADYLLTNLSLPTVTRVLGQTGAHEYARAHLVLLVLGWAVVTALAWRRFGYRPARNLTVMLAVSPAVTVSMQWLGQPDPLTFLLGLVMVLVRPRWAVALTGVLAGLTHPEQAVFMALTAAAVRALLEERNEPGSPAGSWSTFARSTASGACWAVGGVVVGRMVTEVYFRVSSIVLLRPRSDYLGFGVDGFWDHHTQELLGLLYTLWGPLWLVILAVIVLRVTRRTLDHTSSRSWLILGVLALVGLAPVLVTLDETRVYAVITAPLLVGAAVLLDRERPPVPVRWIPTAAGILLVLGAVVPGGFATGVTSWKTQLPQSEMREFLISGDHPGELTPWLLGPFDFVIPDL